MKEKNQAASALGKLSAKRFDGMTKEQRSEYMRIVRSGKKAKKIKPE